MQKDEKLMTPLCYSIAEVAWALRCSVRMIQDQVHTGKLPHFRIGRRVIISTKQLEEFIERQTVSNFRYERKADEFMKKRPIKRTTMKAEALSFKKPKLK